MLPNVYFPGLPLTSAAVISCDVLADISAFDRMRSWALDRAMLIRVSCYKF